jgi:hypothetical protein
VVLLRSMTDQQFDRTFYHPDSKKTITLFEALGMYDWHSRHHLAHLRLIK